MRCGLRLPGEYGGNVLTGFSILPSVQNVNKKALCEVVDFFSHVKKRGIFLHEAGCRVKKIG